MNDPLSIRLEHGDALLTEADAVAVQYPQRLYGLVERAVTLFAAAERPVLLPPKDGVRFLDGVAGIAAPRILLVGVAPVREYDYRDLRSFSHRALTYLAALPGVRHVALPAYGPPGYRLDDAKSFEVEIEGIVDAVRGGAVRGAVQTLTLVERDQNRAQRLWQLLADGLVARVLDKARESVTNVAYDPSAATSPPRSVADPRQSPMVFLCYRREDTEDAAGRVRDRLAAAYGSDRVFMDIDSVPLGVNFVTFVAAQLRQCGAVLVMIGRAWTSVTDREGNRRLDDPADHVRVEIAAALKQGVPVIPLLVQNASMPRASELPEDIRDLAFHNGMKLTAEFWGAGVDRLIKELNRVLG